MEAYYPRAHVLHGVEHVIALFFKDLASHPVVKVRGGCNTFYFLHNYSSRDCLSPTNTMQRMILMDCRLYNVFGSGASHGIYALFQAHAALHNDGKSFGLLRGTSIRMASWFIAMERSLWQRGALLSLVHDPQYVCFHIVKTEDKVRLATIDVCQDRRALEGQVQASSHSQAGSCCALLCGLQRGKYGQHLFFDQSDVKEFGKVCR